MSNEELDEAISDLRKEISQEFSELRAGQTLIAKAVIELLSSERKPAVELAREWISDDLRAHFNLRKPLAGS